LALAAISTVAVASVSFNASTGTGFVGKGDIQTAFNLNNPQIQAVLTACPTTAAANCNLDFAYAAVDRYQATCTWTTGEGTKGEKIHDVDHKRRTEVLGGVSYDSRQRSQVTGFMLTGYAGDPVATGTVPVVGSPCVPEEGSGHDGTWTAVVLVSSEGGLEACMTATATTTTGKGRNAVTVTTVTMVCKAMPNTPVL
jgi:hypothetical protein